MMIEAENDLFVLIDLDAGNVLSDFDTAEESLVAIRRVAKSHGWPAVERLSLMRVQGEDQRLVAMNEALVELARSSDEEQDLRVPRPGMNWRTFEEYARFYFSKLWGIELRSRSVQIAGAVTWQFDLVSPDLRIVGDAKWFKTLKVPAAKWQAIAEYIWLLQKIPADKTFIVFGHDADVAERFLRRVRPLTAPVEFYFLDETGHRQL